MKVIRYEGVRHPEKRKPVEVAFKDVPVGKRCFGIGDNPRLAFVKTSGVVASRGDQKISLEKTKKVIVFGGGK